MTDKQFQTLMGVGAVCCVAIIAIAGCVKHIVSTVFDRDHSCDCDCGHIIGNNGNIPDLDIPDLDISGNDF